MEDTEIRKRLVEEIKEIKFRKFIDSRQNKVDDEYFKSKFSDYCQDINETFNKFMNIINSDDYKELCQKREILRDNISQNCLDKLIENKYVSPMNTNFLLYGTEETWNKIGHELKLGAKPVVSEEVKYLKEYPTGRFDEYGFEFINYKMVEESIDIYKYSDTKSEKPLLEMVLPKSKSMNYSLFTENPEILFNIFEDIKPEGYTLVNKNNDVNGVGGLCNYRDKIIEIDTRIKHDKILVIMPHEFGHGALHEDGIRQLYQREMEASLISFFMAKDLNLESKFPTEYALKHIVKESVAGVKDKNFIENIKESFVRCRLYSDIFSRDLIIAYNKHFGLISNKLDNSKEVLGLKENDLNILKKDIDKNDNSDKKIENFIDINLTRSNTKTSKNKSLVINKGEKSNRKNKI